MPVSTRNLDLRKRALDACRPASQFRIDTGRKIRLRSMYSLNPEVFHQLTLGVGLREGHEFDNFAGERNLTIVKALRSLSDSVAGPLIYLWGAKGDGKTHLLEAVCAAAGGTGARVAYVPLRERGALDPSILSGLESAHRVCVDDADVIAGDGPWEEALFHLYNRLESAKVPLILSATLPPLKTGWRLKDLKSRLAAGTVFEISPLNDEERAEVLKHRAVARGFEFPDEALRYTLQRGPRDMHSLVAVLDRIDSLSLTQHRRITVPLVKQALSVKTRTN